jgi:protein translocase SEC61 complex gamma subunit
MRMNINSEIRKMIRVLRVSTRPRKKEFEVMAKVVLAGVVIMGVLGTLVMVIFTSIDTFGL